MFTLKCFAATTVLSLCAIGNIMAQFHTVVRNNDNYYLLEEKKNKAQNAEIALKDDSLLKTDIKTIPYERSKFREIRERNNNRAKKNRIEKNIKERGSKLNGLTLVSLYEEILKNNIKYPKVVLAQAILETGWFKSSVCRNKGNLFGLRNPRIHDYYNFSDWRESVKAYYDKVQYKYKGGNYLLWLKKIGYAEDPGYIDAVMRVMKQL